MTSTTVKLGMLHEQAATADRAAGEKLTVKEWLQIALWAGASISIGLAGLIAALIEAA